MLLPTAGLICAVLFCAAPVAAADAETDFFEKKIRPVLVARCYKCHAAGAKIVKGGLLLDTRAGIRRGGESGPAVVPGKPEESLLLDALRHESFEMPPDGKLAPEVIADFERWIKRGAADPREGSAVAHKAIDFEQARRFWAFQPVREPAVPEVNNAAWPRSELDRFILARLEAERLEPIEDADRATVCRRLYFDLVGLPPPPEEIDRFVADQSPEALPRLVDRLLASPHFGERWGRHWLDVARFAESSGGGRTLVLENAWRYRDYVIRALNDDKPYDRFVVEQIAGDLLPYDTLQQGRDQLTATGFLVLGPTNYELQDKELLRMEVIDEQINTIGLAFMGMTIGCARCHDHKFDPIPTTDYYALAGIFRSTKTLLPGNVSGYVQQPLPADPATAEKLAAHRKLESEQQARVKQAKDRLNKLAGQLAARTGAGKLAGIVVDDAEARLEGEWKRSTSVKPFLGDVYLHDGAAGKGQKSATFTAMLPEAGEYEVRVSYTPSTNRAPQVPVTVRHAEGKTTVTVNQQRKPRLGMFTSLGKFRFEAGAATVVISNDGTTQHVIADGVQFIPQDTAEAAAKAEAEDPEVARLKTDVKKAEATVKAAEAELAGLKKQAPPSPPLVMSVHDEEQSGDYHVCIRGNVRNLGPVVPRGFLTVIAGEEKPGIAGGQSGRLELARWLASPEHPLTARVIVNRIWHHLLGEGLVRTVDNFGTTGEPPSHPELLDWLATQFVADGWSVKRMIRRIALSRVYGLSSAPHPLAAAADPENRLLARHSRRRLEAEAIRDAILWTSGQLDKRGGGASIRPGTNSEFGYKFQSRRRSVYVPAFRNTLHELFEVFDVANPNLVTGRRNTSTLPTQALYLMNSPMVMEQSRHAADALLARDDLADTAARIEAACRRALGRPPTAAEQQLAEDFLADVADQPLDQQREAWAGFFQALFSCLDFRYVD